MKTRSAPSSDSCSSARGLLRRFLADDRIPSCSQASGELLAQLDSLQSTGLKQGLGIGVQNAKSNLAEIGGDHPIHCVTAPTSDSDHFDPG